MTSTASTASTATDINAREGRVGANDTIADALRASPTADERARWPHITRAQLAAHGTVRDGWIAVCGRVFDISAFAMTHPGFNNAGQVSTAIAIARALGSDATETFGEIHSVKAWAQLGDFQIGILVEEAGGEDDDAKEMEVEEMTYAVPVPSWLSRDRDFWVNYAGGVSSSVIRYLEAHGVPQSGKKRSEGSENADADDDAALSTESSDSSDARKQRRSRAWQVHGVRALALVTCSVGACVARARVRA